MAKVIRIEQLAQLADEWRQAGKSIVCTNGCFDLLHVGHVRVLKQAKALGDLLVVGVNSDASVKRLKGPERPITGEDDRAEILASLECVDYVSIFPQDTAIEFLTAVKPAIYVKGADYKPSDLAEAPVVESFGGRIELLELVPNHSTSSIVSKMKG